MLLVLVVAVVVSFMFWLALATSLLKSKARKKALAEAPTTLDAAFDGRDDVTFEVSDMTLPVNQVISGAAERGYRVKAQIAASKTGSTLIFERV